MRPSPFARDRFALYEAAVQGVEYDLDFFERAWRSLRGGRFQSLRKRRRFENQPSWLGMVVGVA
jgi:hypothetical protein